MKQETINKVYRKGIPQEPNGNKVNQILLQAKKAGLSLASQLELTQLAYRGFMEFLHEYGGGPESFDDLACKHITAYLKLVLSIQDKAEQENRIEELRIYLIKKNNMMTDDKDDIFETITGISVNRPSRY